jgi:hypothetical protein
MKNPELKLAKLAKSAGYSRKKFIAVRTESVNAVATRDNWRRSETAMALQLVTTAADAVYGASTSRSTPAPKAVPAPVTKSTTPARLLPPRPLTRDERAERQARMDSSAKPLRSMRASKGWTHYHVWEPKIVTIKQGDGTANMMSREKLYTVFVSPKGNEYTHALDTEPADLLHTGVVKALGVPPVRLVRISKSLVVKNSERARRRAEKIRQAREDV